MNDSILKSDFDDWKHFEDHVHELLSSANRSLAKEGLEVFKHKVFQGSKGKWEVDVAYEFKMLGVSHLVLVECKYYSRKVGREQVTHFLASVVDLSASRGILVSNQGFTSGAIELARGTQVELLNLVEFYHSIEADLTIALRKELVKQIIDMRDEAIFVSMKYGFDGITGRFIGIQSALSEYVDFECQYPLPFEFKTKQLEKATFAVRHIATNVEYLVAVLDNVHSVRSELKKNVDLEECEYTQLR